jgi:5-methylcytosine-specific restriction protein A
VPGHCIVLNLWYRNMVETSEGFIEQHFNLIRDQATETDGGRRKRRHNMLTAIQYAFSEGLPVRVIVLKVKPPKPGHAVPKNEIKLRTLDPVPWSVVSIATSGDLVLRRGAHAPLFVDQFSIDEVAPAADRERTFVVRDRSREVRTEVLRRANGVCELCGSPGFRLINGSVYLETHHVVPLSEDGADHETNVVGICPNDHREAHYGVLRDEIRARLLALLKPATPAAT